MEKNSNPLLKHAATYGAIIGSALVIYSLLMYFLGLYAAKQSGWISYLILFAGIMVSSKQYREQELKGNISYAQALGYGVLVSLFASIILAFYNYVFYTLIDPSAINQVFEIMEEELINSGMPDADIEKTVEAMAKYYTPLIMSLSLIPSLTFVGFLFSLISSIFVKKQILNPFDDAMKGIEN